MDGGEKNVKRVASIGECMLELSADGDAWRMSHAGDTLNTLWAIRALLPAGDRTDYVTAFGDDAFSRQQRDFLAAAGIGTAASPVLPGERPGLYAITLEGPERSFTYWRSDSAARRLADDPAKLAKSLAGRSLVYFSGITLAIVGDRRATLLDALQAARGEGSLIAFDANFRPRLWASSGEAQEAFAAALAICDIALPTFPDEQALYGDVDPAATAARLQQFGIAEIVVKNGAEPALVRAGGDRHTVPAEEIASPVDTTGAGDSFNGGYLAARLLGREPRQAAVLAHRVAAATVQVRGALAPMEELRAAFNRKA